MYRRRISRKLANATCVSTPFIYLKFTNRTVFHFPRPKMTLNTNKKKRTISQYDNKQVQYSTILLVIVKYESAVIQRQQSSENGRWTFKVNRLFLCAKERPVQIRQNDRNAFYKSTCYALKYSSSCIYSKLNAFNCELMRTNVRKD
ncbi:putative protein TFG [Trichinella spiralis]|uniref:putative protein TFG n=1 Tax=Trichinella spiralis TaxID=6334 RepID=UPI0001EFF03A|nr:putative protein TFG [Trichinella spiralis]